MPQQGQVASLPSRAHGPLGIAAFVVSLVVAALFLALAALDVALFGAARPKHWLAAFARSVPAALWGADLVAFGLALAALFDPQGDRKLPLLALAIVIATTIASVAVVMWFTIASAGLDII